MPQMQSTTAPPTRPARRSVKLYLWGILLGAILLGAFYVAFMLWYSYSEGERAGVLQKFSRRGWVCKTYEGELALYVVGGVSPQIWNFSVRDAKVAESLHHVVGRQVRLHYSEHPGLPTTCFGETDYFVDGYELATPVAPAHPSPGMSVTPAPPAANPPAP